MPWWVGHVGLKVSSELPHLFRIADCRRNVGGVFGLVF